MAHVQTPRDIGWWQHDAIGFAVVARRKIMALFPGLIPELFDGFWVIDFIHRSTIRLIVICEC